MVPLSNATQKQEDYSTSIIVRRLNFDTPRANGMLGLAHLGWQLKDERTHILHTLKHAGYQTALAGMQHVCRPPPAAIQEAIHRLSPHSRKRFSDIRNLGYDELLYAAGTKSYQKDDARTAREACAFIQRTNDRFFLNVGFNATHRGYPQLETEEEASYVQPPAPLPDHNDTRRDFARYKKSVQTLDHHIGTVLAAIEQKGLTENTIVIITTDHGPDYPSMKATLSNLGTGVMLMLRGPGINNGAVHDSLVSHIDVFPTICDLLSIDQPKWLEGRSIKPILDGTQTEVNECIYSEQNYHNCFEPTRAIITQTHKYILRLDDRQTIIARHVCGSESGDYLLSNDWAKRSVEKQALYDLIHDPYEQHNIVHLPHSEPLYKKLEYSLNTWRQETNDPLLSEKYEMPSGILLNDPNQPRGPAKLIAVLDGELSIPIN